MHFISNYIYFRYRHIQQFNDELNEAEYSVLIGSTHFMTPTSFMKEVMSHPDWIFCFHEINPSVVWCDNYVVHGAAGAVRGQTGRWTENLLNSSQSDECGMRSPDNFSRDLLAPAVKKKLECGWPLTAAAATLPHYNESWLLNIWWCGLAPSRSNETLAQMPWHSPFWK